MLLNGEIRNDDRVIKTISSLSKRHKVDLYYVPSKAESSRLNFSENVELYPIPQRNGLGKWLIRHSFFYNEFLFFVKHVLSRNIKYDFIYANDLPCLKPASILARKLNAGVVYDAHEIYVETINQFFPSQAPFFKKIIFNALISFMQAIGKRAEQKMLKHVDYFITVGEGLKKHFEETYGFKDIRVVMNCPVRQEINDKVDYYAILNIPKESFIVLYQGVLNAGRGLPVLIEAMKLTDKRVVLAIIGYGPLEETLKRDVQFKNLGEKVFFLGKIPSYQLPVYTSGAHCGINLLEPINKSKALAAPNKLFQYIHASIPVIASNSYENVKVFEKYKLGFLVENTPEEIADAINTMASINRTEFVENCKKAALEYNWENQEKVLLSLFESQNEL